MKYFSNIISAVALTVGMVIATMAVPVATFAADMPADGNWAERSYDGTVTPISINGVDGLKVVDFDAHTVTRIAGTVVSDYPDHKDLTFADATQVAAVGSNDNDNDSSTPD